jgi:hypothetical protein
MTSGYDVIVGIPSGRRFAVPGLGMYTRLTGKALNGSVFCCTLSASLALASWVSTTWSSTPAVRRPALRSVTRRTLTSVLARDRSINFCNRRTLARSPAFDAGEDPLTQPTYARLNLTPVDLAPLEGRVLRSAHHDQGRGVQLVLRFRDHIVFLFTGSPDRVSARSGRATRARIRPVIRDDPLEGRAIVSRFPAAFRPPAFASRSSDSRRGAQPSSRSASRPNGRTPNGVTAFRTYESRPGCVLSVPRGRRCSSRLERVPSRRLPHSQRLVPAPRRNNPSCEALHHEASTRVQAIHPSGLPLACDPRMERERLGLFPELRTPPTRSRTTHVGEGTGHRARTWNNAHVTSGEPPTSCSLVSCDLASHRALQGGRWCAAADARSFA